MIEREIHTFNHETDKKKAEEKSKGLHEYANKLTAEINAKLAPKKKLGVVREATK